MPLMFIGLLLGYLVYVVYEILAIRFIIKDIKSFKGNGMGMWIFLSIVFPVGSIIMYLIYRYICRK